MAGRAPVSAGGRLFESFRKWYYNAQGFNKYGLKRDDILHETDVVKEAIKRLPEDEYYERIFRIKRAAQLSLTHEILPEDQWTKYEEDKPYLWPHVEEVMRERNEKKNSEINNFLSFKQMFSLECNLGKDSEYFEC